MHILEVKGLAKTFRTSVPREGRFGAVRSLLSREKRTVQAVKRLDFAVERGEFVGFIGPNGAGKSTTIKMLCGILHPSEGEVLVFGRSPQRERRQVARRIGVVFGQRTQLWWDLPLKDSFAILAAMFRLTRSEKERQLDRLNEALSFRDFWDTPVRKLSLGQRMRGDLAAALLHDPELLVLDEPTIGMDAGAKRQIRAHLKFLNEHLGKTVLLTTHDMNDIEQLCRRVLVINRGELIFDGGMAQLRGRIGMPTLIRVVYRREPKLPDAELWASQPRPFRIAGRRERELTVSCNRTETRVLDVLRALGEWGEVDDVLVEEPDFEDIVHEIYEPAK